MKLLLTCLMICIALCAGLFSCREQGPNSVVAFLQGAERQSEDLDQRLEIEKALNDMLTLKPDELRSRRYANYQMQAGAWTIIQLLHRYFASRGPVYIDEDRFYQDVTDPAARAVIQENLRKVREAIALDRRASPPAAEDNEEERE